MIIRERKEIWAAKKSDLHLPREFNNSSLLQVESNFRK